MPDDQPFLFPRGRRRRSLRVDAEHAGRVLEVSMHDGRKQPFVATSTNARVRPFVLVGAAGHDGEATGR